MILKFYYKIVKCFCRINNSIFYEVIITLFQFTQLVIENRSACRAWHACRRLPTAALDRAATEIGIFISCLLQQTQHKKCK
jgi:hypothetical protein